MVVRATTRNGSCSGTYSTYSRVAELLPIPIRVQKMGIFTPGATIG